MKILRISVITVFCLTFVVFSLFLIRDLTSDKTLPEITVTGDILDVSLDATDAELLAGVSARDEKDGDISDKIIVESISNFIEPGVCVATYAVCDGDNHVSTATRRIRYIGYTPPRFTMNASPVFSLSSKVTPNSIIGAYDLLEGDISDKVIVTANEYQSSVKGVYLLSAQVSNGKGETISLDFRVFIEDVSPSAPVIKLENYLIYIKAGDTIDVTKNCLSATDSTGLSLSESVIIDASDLDTVRAGVYTVHYRVTDSAHREGHSVLTVVVEG